MSHILAIDLGKFNSVVCLFDAATREASFRRVKTTPLTCWRAACVSGPVLERRRAKKLGYEVVKTADPPSDTPLSPPPAALPGD